MIVKTEVTNSYTGDKYSSATYYLFLEVYRYMWTGKWTQQLAVLPLCSILVAKYMISRRKFQYVGYQGYKKLTIYNVC